MRLVVLAERDMITQSNVNVSLGITIIIIVSKIQKGLFYRSTLSRIGYQTRNPGFVGVDPDRVHFI